MRKTVSFLTLICFFLTALGPLPAYSQSVPEPFLPAPGKMVALSPQFSPAVLKGIKLDPKDPFKFHFYVDQGVSSVTKEETQRLIKYFLASLTIPEKDLWVNLSPYEKNRVVPQEFGQTEMGRDLLAQDYLLKQITASLIYPEGEVGKKFWQKVYKLAQEKYGTSHIPVNTFNKVWIVPDKAIVYENGGTAFVLENRLKVMLEEDYLAMNIQMPTRGHSIGTDSNSAVRPILGQELVSVPNNLGSQIIRDIVIPELEREVNQGQNFAQLRQVFYSLILATWYKKKIKDSILNKVLANQNKISGVNVSAQDKETIYQQYLQAFKKGVYNYVKEEADPVTGQNVPRKYFSGGVNAQQISVNLNTKGPFQVSKAEIAALSSSSLVDVSGDFAMTAAMSAVPERISTKIQGTIIRRELFNKGLLSDQAKSAVRGLYTESMFQVMGWQYAKVEDIPVKVHGYPKADEQLIAVNQSDNHFGTTTRYFNFTLFAEGETLWVGVGSFEDYTEAFTDPKINQLNIHKKLFWWMEHRLKAFAKKLGFKKIAVSMITGLSDEEMKKIGYEKFESTHLNSWATSVDAAMSAMTALEAHNFQLATDQIAALSKSTEDNYRAINLASSMGRLAGTVSVDVGQRLLDTLTAKFKGTNDIVVGRYLSYAVRDILLSKAKLNYQNAWDVFVKKFADEHDIFSLHIHVMELMLPHVKVIDFPYVVNLTTERIRKNGVDQSSGYFIITLADAATQRGTRIEADDAVRFIFNDLIQMREWGVIDVLYSISMMGKILAHPTVSRALRDELFDYFWFTVSESAPRGSSAKDQREHDYVRDRIFYSLHTAITQQMADYIKKHYFHLPQKTQALRDLAGLISSIPADFREQAFLDILKEVNVRLEPLQLPSHQAEDFINQITNELNEFQLIRFELVKALTGDSAQLFKDSDAAMSASLKQYGFYMAGSRLEWESSKNKKDEEWMMRSMRDMEKKPIIFDMKDMPNIKIDQKTKILYRKAQHEVYIAMALVEGKNEPVLIKHSTSQGELVNAQILDRLGIGPRFYGVVKDQKGNIIGYAMQFVPGTPTKGYEFDHPDNKEMRERLFNIGMNPPVEVMRTPEGRYIAIDAEELSVKPLESYMELYDTFIRECNDAAMKSGPGGIDLNPEQMAMSVRQEGEYFKFNFNGVEINASQITGAQFTIRTMTPVINLHEILGLTSSLTP